MNFIQNSISIGYSWVTKICSIICRHTSSSRHSISEIPECECHQCERGSEQVNCQSKVCQNQNINTSKSLPSGLSPWVFSQIRLQSEVGQIQFAFIISYYTLCNGSLLKWRNLWNFVGVFSSFILKISVYQIFWFQINLLVVQDFLSPGLIAWHWN